MNEVSLTLKYVLVTVCTEATEKQVKTTVLLRIVQQNEAWPGLCTDSACTNADVTATCDGVNSKSITTVVIIQQLPETLRSNGTINGTQITGSPRDVLFMVAVQGNAFNLTSIGAVLDKTQVLVALLRTCTPGYILTGTECVKQEEPPSVSIGAIIGGVVGSLGVVTFIVLVVIVYRRLGRAGRRPSAGRGDEHDCSGLIATGHNAGSGHRGRQAAIQLNHMGLDLNNPGHDGKIQRPVSDYDVIGEENPNIAKYLAERPPARKLRDDPAPCNPYDIIDTCHAPGPLDCTTLADEHADEVSHPDYLSPCSPRKENEEDSEPDYLTPCSSHDNFDKVIHSDQLTPCFGLNDSDKVNHSDYLTLCFGLNDSDKVNHSDYLTPCPKLDI
ncbi:hypothetical protein V1264_020952 [Littorina saxatilis]|uniref:Uncharacterized protein n=1 Tax=Littorina saxatilis TaxID=31220 RepID=A0AAN9BBC6_9CAEN